MSSLLLIGTVGVAADFHICQGKVKTMSLFGDAEKCSAIETGSICLLDTSSAVSKKPCCSDKAIYEDASFQSDVVNHLPLAQKNCCKIPFERAALKITSISQNKKIWVIPDPPIVRQNKHIVIAHQAFLI